MSSPRAHFGISRTGLAALALVLFASPPWSQDKLRAEDVQSGPRFTQPERDAEPTTRPIAGVVVGPDGSPVAGAEVHLVAEKLYGAAFWGKLPRAALPVEQRIEGRIGHSQREVLGRAHTDASGRFAIMPRPAGPPCARPALVVRADGLAFAYRCLTQVAGYGTTHEELREIRDELHVQLAEMVPIRGRLLSPEGTPVEGVLVRVRRIHLPRIFSINVCFCRSDAIPGTHAPASSRSSKWPLSEESRSSNAHPTRAAVDKQDRYLPEFWPRSVVTDGDGAFTLEGMPSGSRVYLTLIHVDLAPETIVVHTLSGEVGEYVPGEPRPVPSTFRHTLGIPRPVEGVVTAADTGKPLAGVFVQVAAMQFVDVWHGSGEIFTRTDKQGHYRVNCHINDNYNIAVYPVPDSGYLSMATPRLDASPQGGLVKDFRLDPGFVVRGRVVDAETESPIRAASVVYLPTRSRASSLQTAAPGSDNPTLTDEDGRFALTVPSGPGFLSVEATDRSYLRMLDVDGLLQESSSRNGARRAAPMSLTRVDVSSEAPPPDVTEIRLHRGRTVVLQAVGPNGESLPWVHAVWEGIDAVHDSAPSATVGFAKGRVVVSGLDPSRGTRVFLICQPRECGAVFDIPPGSKDKRLEVRLQPNATITGRCITPSGQPAPRGRGFLQFSLDPQVTHFTTHGYRQHRYTPYENFHLRHFSTADEKDPPNPDGRFTLENVVPGAPFGLALARSEGKGLRFYTSQIVNVEPLEAGEKRDVGDLMIGQQEPVGKKRLPWFVSAPFYFGIALLVLLIIYRLRRRILR